MQYDQYVCNVKHHLLTNLNGQQLPTAHWYSYISQVNQMMGLVSDLGMLQNMFSISQNHSVNPHSTRNLRMSDPQNQPLQARGELEALTSEEKIALEVQTTGELTQRSNVANLEMNFQVHI